MGLLRNRRYLVTAGRFLTMPLNEISSQPIKTDLLLLSEQPTQTWLREEEANDPPPPRAPRPLPSAARSFIHRQRLVAEECHATGNVNSRPPRADILPMSASRIN
ncbi:unnamed protein product, partial [Iphiclides podalirius]